MRVYIAGPMSGYPKFNIPAFDQAADVLRRRGFTVYSPAEIDGPVTRSQLLESEEGDHADLPQDESWSFYLARDFRILADENIEAIATLPGWEDSKGAGLEVALGRQLGIPQIDLGTLIRLQDEYGDALSADGLREDTLYDGDGNFITHEANPLRQRSVSGGVKDNRGKPQVDLIPSKPLLAVGRVLGFGANKYKPHNWRLGLSWTQTMGSAMRHLLAFNDGEDIDPESGECHVDNALCQLLFLSEYFHTQTGEDDRFSAISKEDARA